MSFLMFVDETFLFASGALMAAGFLLWELPRSLRLLDEENEKIVYPAKGRILDIFLFVVGLFSFVFYIVNPVAVINALRMPTFSLGFSIIYVAGPLMIFLAFIGKAIKMLNEHDSLSRFFMCFLFSLFRTIFYVSFSFVFLAVAIFLFVTFYY